MSDLPQHAIRLAELPNRKPSRFEIVPDAAGRAALAESLGILMLRKLRFAGALIPLGKQDWRLEADLGATVSQACVATLEPVTSRIDETVRRAYVANYDIPAGEEVEMPEDDNTDPMPETLDLIEVLTEALALSLPPYPRKDDASPIKAQFTEPGIAAMTDEDARPFAGLAALRDSLSGTEQDRD